MDVERIFRSTCDLVTRFQPGRDGAIPIETARASLCHRPEDVVIGAATAEMPGESRADFLTRGYDRAPGVAPVVVECRRLDDKARRAKPTLQRVERHERLLHRMQRGPADPLHCCDRSPGRSLCRSKATGDGHAIKQHRTRAADA